VPVTLPQKSGVRPELAPNGIESNIAQHVNLVQVTYAESQLLTVVQVAHQGRIKSHQPSRQAIYGQGVYAGEGDSPVYPIAVHRACSFHRVKAINDR
jgi:hypothetical protein